MTERSTETEADTLTGGEGSDTSNINLQFPEAGLSSGTINIATLTDFDPETEQLNITTDRIDEEGVAFRGLSLSQAENGSFTDVIANYAALDEGGAQTQAVIRLEGVRDLDISRINLSTGMRRHRVMILSPPRVARSLAAQATTCCCMKGARMRDHW